MLYADAVFEGGGVKGIGLVGAVCYMEKVGYRWKRFAGTSAGAIVAALLAAGFTGEELKEIIFNTDYRKFLSKDALQHLPVIGRPLGLLKERGIYTGDYIEQWIAGLLKAKNKTKFKDVFVNGEFILKIIASDITKKNILILPDGLYDYGIDPMEFDIARAVRMSIGIPFYFTPVVLHSKKGISYIVDGGILSNFPIWIFDVAGTPRWPTFGFKLIEEDKKLKKERRNDFLSYSLSIIDTMLEKNESIYIHHKDYVRTIGIPTIDVGTTEFHISREKSKALYQSGMRSAAEFVKAWNFSKYVSAYRRENAIEV